MGESVTTAHMQPAPPSTRPARRVASLDARGAAPRVAQLCCLDAAANQSQRTRQLMRTGEALQKREACAGSGDCIPGAPVHTAEGDAEGQA